MVDVDTVTVPRKKLYTQVWTIPGARLAAMYGISDVGLAKACKRYDIPRPPRGYWARIEAGQKIRRPPLPKTRPSDELVYFTGWFMTEAAIEKAAYEDRKPSPTVDLSGMASHASVMHLREEFAATPVGIDGLVPVSAMDVLVSVTSRDRCVALMDTLTKGWLSRGGSINTVSAQDKKAVSTLFAIGEDKFGVRIVENIDDSKPVTDPSRLTGNLCLYITGHEDRQFRRRWSDTKSQRLERMLTQVVETLVSAIDVERQTRLDEECVQRQREKVSGQRGAWSSYVH